ncbi:cobyrinate a,c-diamide synthase [Nocardiopsis sp. MG754419]|uniref:cobyrinate a,c-diamide synthase n=1 Tax=Nocardiopsis sp. MG754419 TaxID=2259865 RepID=UPI001BAA9251|nr:cobyrinate a,c-diamide synthase [Nocardiopsis sp. MG754419]MBR8741885.1 cobyrinic acid a,c-diamide synthase [Nocardiopsis sp. MG754419]
MIAAPMTGQGKTTIATGLMAALVDAGLAVSGHKVGPDYIDPGYHALATGRPGRNLDPHLVGEDRVVPLLLHGARGADVAVVEGVMGLHDGRIGTDGFASSAHVATLTRTPVVLVVDVSRMSRSVGALVAGMADFDPAVEVVGVILNKAGSARNVAEITRSVRLPVLGVVPRDERIASPSRHLGLVPASEYEGSARVVARLGAHMAAHVDLDALVEVARAAPALDGRPWEPATEVRSPDGGDRPVVAVAGGRTFTFRYTETEELLTAAGCAVVHFDPLTDTALPAGTRGVYLGGGFPEVHADGLAANRSLPAALREAVRAGVPTVAECAGLLYLAESLDGHAMAGAVPAHARMTRRLTLRYPEALAPRDTLLTRAGERVTGHEFHRTTLDPGRGDLPAWEIDGAPEGFASPTLHASYLHVHWAGHPRLATRFADAVHAFAATDPSSRAPGRTGPAPSARSTPDDPPPDDGTATSPRTEPVADPLRHHGDVEARGGLLDFAVNVHPGERPAWLDRALRASLDEVGVYPDETPARAALARRHSRPPAEVLPTAGAAEAFTLIARARPWRRPVVVHPQFTEPHAALDEAGHTVTTVLCGEDDGFVLDPARVPEDADLVMVGNPTNPTGVLHPASVLRGLCRPGRLVVVDEAFMDALPGEPESCVGDRIPGLVVLRSLTKHWSIPGVRAGYVVGEATVVRELARVRTPWSVSTSAIAAMIACSTGEAGVEAQRRARELDDRRADLEAGLRATGIAFVPSRAPFVLARVGEGVHARLRDQGIAVRRADTFPGLDATWVRVAVRPPEATRTLLAALARADGSDTGHEGRPSGP